MRGARLYGGDETEGKKNGEAEGEADGWRVAVRREGEECGYDKGVLVEMARREEMARRRAHSGYLL